MGPVRIISVFSIFWRSNDYLGISDAFIPVVSAFENEVTTKSGWSLTGLIDSAGSAPRCHRERHGNATKSSIQRHSKCQYYGTGTQYNIISHILIVTSNFWGLGNSDYPDPTGTKHRLICPSINVIKNNCTQFLYILLCTKCMPIYRK